jgi:hypothetical protein
MLAAVAAYVNQGQAVQVAGAPQSGQVRMTVGPEREFIGVGEIDDEGRVAPKRLCVITTNTTRSDPQAVSTRVGRCGSFPLRKGTGTIMIPPSFHG